MDRRKALTISLALDKDDSRIGSPLKIAKTLLSSKSGCRKIHWTQITGPKVRYHDTNHKNGCSKKPCLILTDVLKTDLGKAYMNGKSGSRISNPAPKECCKRQESPSYTEVGIGSTHSDRSETPTSYQKTPSAVSRRQGGTARRGRNRKDSLIQSASKQIHHPPSTPQREKRSFLRRKSEEKREEAEEEVQAVIVGEENNGGERFTQVMDCGMSLSWRAAEDPTTAEVSPQRWTDQVKETGPHQGKNCDSPELHCNGTSSAKRSRRSVLRHSGETRDGEGPSPKRRCLESPGGEGQDMVAPSDCEMFLCPGAGEDGTEKAPGTCSLFKEKRGVLRPGHSPSLDSTALTSSSEFIVLSSDDDDDDDDDDDEEEENSAPVASQARDSVLHPQAGSSEAELQRYSPQEENGDSQEGEVYSQQAHVVAAKDLEAPPDPRPEHNDEFPVMSLPFSALRCGFHWAQADGPIAISEKRISMPVKGLSGRRRLRLTLQRSGLWRYCIWDQQEHLARGLAWEDGEWPLPAAFLLLYMSDTQALTVHRELTQLLVDQEWTPFTGPPSPFLLLSLNAPMEGVEGALFRSILDLICINNSSHHDPQAVQGGVTMDMSGDLQSPLLSVDDCVTLIRMCGLDPELLAALGQDTAEPGNDWDWDRAQAEPQPDQVQGTTSLIPLEVESQEEAESQADPQTEPPPQAEETLKEAEVELTSGKSPPKVRPVHTLCHHRTKNSYAVSLSRPDSTWTKYKHQGPARRLIQFPPSPLKGGIPVTMEDLECLDSGHFLNDVIIDFYLKYLLLKRAPAGVAERSHIFSSFFYKQLTRRDNASEENTSASTQRQRRHQRVKNWTRHVDIFNKDFLFVPVNQESHWYLVVICFPGLAHVLTEPWRTEERESGLAQSDEEAQDSRNADGESECGPSQTEPQCKVTGAENVQVESPAGPPDCTEQTCQRANVCKRPCILIMDSLKVSLHERVFKLLREYLQSEWEVRRGFERDFSGEQMKSSHCRVPLQDNSSDCGLYLLQYVESFLEDPVVHFDLPLRLERWFPRQLVRRKRDEIRDLVLYLYRVQSPANGSC